MGGFRSAYPPEFRRPMVVLVRTGRAPEKLSRQLDPTPEGLPLEIHAFANTVRWETYEAIRSDIFDHVLSILPEFGLRQFHAPTGRACEGSPTD